MPRLLIIILLLFSTSNFALEVPLNISPVVDKTGIFSRKDLAIINQALTEFKRRHHIAIQALIIKSLEGESIENYSIEVVDQWKIGDKKLDNGILFLVALNDRKMRIEVGDGLEGVITDLQAGEIIRQIRPLFRNARYQDGVIYALTLIAKATGGELNFKQAIRTKNNRRSGFSLGSLLFFIILFSLFSGRGGGGLFNALFFASLLGGRSNGYSDDSFGGFSGGGFGDGGGFSGGGASGDW